jgi:pimeloyl-ACP methyl ester carboxylesterase
LFCANAFSQEENYQSQTANLGDVNFKAFNKQDAEDDRRVAAHKLPMPVLVIAGDKAMGDALEIQAKIVADNVTSINVTSMKFTDTGHWLMEERPAETKAAPMKFLSPAAQASRR